jgi:hypothetical protein
MRLMTGHVILRFLNRTAEEAVKMTVERSATPHIMAWYGAFCAGDDYDVYIDGEKQQIGINGEFQPLTIEGCSTAVE